MEKTARSMGLVSMGEDGEWSHKTIPRLMVSCNGCRAQALHMDTSNPQSLDECRETANRKKCKFDSAPVDFFCVATLSQEASLLVSDYNLQDERFITNGHMSPEEKKQAVQANPVKVLRLPAWHIVFASQEKIHGGAAYDACNLRMHCFFNRPPDTDKQDTWMVDHNLSSELAHHFFPLALANK